MLNTQFSSWPSFTQEESDAVSKVLLSNKVNYWTGQEGREFEKEFAQFSNSKYAVAVANGTLALDLALVALNVGARNGGSENDEVVVTSRTFLASASSLDIVLFTSSICLTLLFKVLSSFSRLNSSTLRKSESFSFFLEEYKIKAITTTAITPISNMIIPRSFQPSSILFLYI